MPMKVYWEDETKTVIRTIGEGSWTWDDYHASLDKIAEMMRSTDHRVDILNIRQSRAMMPRGSAMPHFRRAMDVLPPNFGIMVLVSGSRFSAMIVNMFIKLYPSRSTGRVIMVATEAEARKVIEKDLAQAEAIPSL